MGAPGDNYWPWESGSSHDSKTQRGCPGAVVQEVVSRQVGSV